MPFRGGRGRGGYRRDDHVEYRSNEGDRHYDDDELSDRDSEPEPLTAEEQEYLKNKVEDLSPKLEGVVTGDQIQKKCIEMDFDDDKIELWAKSLIQNDKRVKGLKEFEWNATLTKDEKHLQRVRKLQAVHIRKEREMRRKEYEQRKKERQEERDRVNRERREKRERIQKEREAQRQLEEEQRKAEQGDEPENEGDGDEHSEDHHDEETEPEAKHHSDEDRHSKKPQRGGHKGKMVYKPKSEASQVKTDKKGMVYKKKDADEEAKEADNQPAAADY